MNGYILKCRKDGQHNIFEFEMDPLTDKNARVSGVY